MIIQPMMYVQATSVIKDDDRSHPVVIDDDGSSFIDAQCIRGVIFSIEKIHPVVIDDDRSHPVIIDDDRKHPVES